MAEIKIEKKNKTIWPLVIGLIVLAILIILLIFYLKGSDKVSLLPLYENIMVSINSITAIYSS